MKLLLAAFIALAAQLSSAAAEDGYDLWLRYGPLPERAADAAAPFARQIIVEGDSPTLRAVRQELSRALEGLLAREIATTGRLANGAILAGTPASSPAVRALGLGLEKLGEDGFLIRSATIGGKRTIIVAANADLGVLYGAFELLRRFQTGAPLEGLDEASSPKIKIRMLNHWDDLNGFVERGYAGQSIWDWHKLPSFVDPRYTDYARAMASVGLNGATINNVNANAQILTPAYLERVAAIAGALRPYGVRVYLSARFSAPAEIGGLNTADPLDPSVAQWWRDKTDEIYRLIPDFGGFLVKANSEGQPGPQDYGRTHADGANMLAEAVAPHNGVIVWRAFVYANRKGEDRTKQAFDEFAPLDGKFRGNVFVQAKNGPLDFQPREPFNPLFGAMPRSNLALEFQITKEYLGFETHLVYLGPLFEETLRAETGRGDGAGGTVAAVIENGPNRDSLIAGVSNVGSDRNWTGSIFDQANWYAFGRLAWDPSWPARDIAEDWLRRTFTQSPEFVEAATDIMMESRETAVDYMTPLGLSHQMATGHHYGPGPWIDDAGRDDWNPVYYNRADADGVGFDRTHRGSAAASQYSDAVAAQFNDPAATPESLLLWFHHLPWDFRLKSGDTLWHALVNRYDRGVNGVRKMRAQWNTLQRFVDSARFEETSALLKIQEAEALWWRDASIAYFQSVSKRPFPAGTPPPAHDLSYYKSLRFEHLEGY